MMRALATAAVLLACLPGCGQRPPDGGSRQAEAAWRRDGLWQQTVTRDGHARALGRFQLCVDPATDERLSVIGSAAAKARCDRRSTRGADGAVSFTSRCRLAKGGLAETQGKVWSDYQSSYRLHAQTIISGAPFGVLNGEHMTDVSARYVGPCPADMAPGDAILGPGLKVNLRKLPIDLIG